MEGIIPIKVCTVNIPESYVESIEKLVGENGAYPSRSELIRVAVRDFLLQEIKISKKIAKFKEEKIKELDEENYVKVPIKRLNEKNEPVREFKTYKILRKLSYNDSQEKSKEDHGDFIWKRDFNETYDPNPHLKEYSPPSLNELRNKYPNVPYFKSINE